MVMTPFRQELADLGVIQLAPQPLNQLFAGPWLNNTKFMMYWLRLANVVHRLLQQSLVDEMISYVAPTLLGQSARAMFNAEFSQMAEQLRFGLVDITQLGGRHSPEIAPYPRDDMNPEPSVYHKRRHAARTTDEYLFISSFPISVISVVLLHLILERLKITETLNSKKETHRFCWFLCGSGVVSRLAWARMAIVWLPMTGNPIVHRWTMHFILCWCTCFFKNWGLSKQ